VIGTDRARKIARLRSYLQPSAVDIKSLKSRKLSLTLINVLSVRITGDQYETLNESIYAVHQSFSGFNTAELCRPHSVQLSLVVWELALTCDALPLFAICATLARILLSLVVAGQPCCFTAGGNTGSDAINFTYRNFRSPIWRYNYRLRNDMRKKSCEKLVKCERYIYAKSACFSCAWASSTSRAQSGSDGQLAENWKLWST